MKSYVIPAYRAPGRCAGGLAQFSDNVVEVKHERCVTRGWRVQAQVLHLPAGRILWINTYMPTDPGPVATWDEHELVTSLAEVESLLTHTSMTSVCGAGTLIGPCGAIQGSQVSWEPLLQGWDWCQCGPTTQWTILTSTLTSSPRPRLTISSSRFDFYHS